MASSEKPHRPILDPFEDVDWLPARAILARHGFEPEPPEAIDDAAIRGRLWELIYAMAAQKFYLGCTDHLSDRELYRWLLENWIDEAAADLPPEAELAARISPVTFESEEEGTMIWLRYYADEEERQQFTENMLPPHEDPGHDRDRFLPDAPTQCGDLCECEGEGLDEVEDALFGDVDSDSDDPLGLDAVDAAIRAGHEPCGSAIPDFDGEGEPDSENWQQPFQLLQRHGVALFPPDEHTDETIGASLWELLHELACRGFYVLHTDHLTDRELYAALWKDSLREPAILPGRSPTAAWYHDLIGSGSEADEQLHLRFYATDEQRAKALRENPGLKIPPHTTAAAHRDWRSPKGPV